MDFLTSVTVHCAQHAPVSSWVFHFIWFMYKQLFPSTFLVCICLQFLSCRSCVCFLWVWVCVWASVFLSVWEQAASSRDFNHWGVSNGCSHATQHRSYICLSRSIYIDPPGLCAYLLSTVTAVKSHTERNANNTRVRQTGISAGICELTSRISA